MGPGHGVASVGQRHGFEVARPHLPPSLPHCGSTCWADQVAWTVPGLINCSSSTNMISPSIGNASMNNQRGHVSKKWWYMGCELCKKRLHNEGGSYYCQPCDCRSAIPMYKFSLIAADETAEARFFCHDIVAHHLICRNYNSLLKPISYPPGLPAQMLAIIPRKYMFPVGLTV